MPNSNGSVEEHWLVIVVEDNADVRRQIRELLDGVEMDDRTLRVVEIDNFTEALNHIRDHKANLIVLDVYRGDARPGGERSGLDVLEQIRDTGFVPVVLYTALPEGIEDQASCFVRVVGKDVGGLGRLEQEIREIFASGVPRVHRAVVDHLDRSLCTYMWGFLQERWDELEALVGRPEFLRLLLQRLAVEFARGSIGEESGTSDSNDKAHPAEYYVKPPIGVDPLRGDVRKRSVGGSDEHWIVLWPSCDMVTTANRTLKIDSVLCARAFPLETMPEFTRWKESPSNTKKSRLEDLMGNNRDSNFGSSDRHHFLPGVWDIPDLVVDFQVLEHISLSELREYDCLATVASPFVEELGARFLRYIGRLGTPDIDVAQIIERLGEAGEGHGQDGTADSS